MFVGCASKPPGAVCGGLPGTVTIVEPLTWALRKFCPSATLASSSRETMSHQNSAETPTSAPWKSLADANESNRSVVVPNGIDLAEIEGIGPSTRKSDALFVGRLIKEKNTDLLIRSLPLVKETFPDIKCTIIGEGPEKEKLEGLTGELGLLENVEFAGFLDSYSDVISNMKSSKVLVLPSRREGFGMVVVEANACGVPVVVVDHTMNAAKDLITPGKNGFIADISEESLADKITRGINSKEELKDKCKDFAKDFDWDKIVDQLEIAYWDFLLKK